MVILKNNLVKNSSVAGVGICTPSSSAVQAVHSNPTEHSRFVCRLVTFLHTPDPW